MVNLKDEYAIEEFKFLKRLKEIGFLSTSQFIIRFIARILPKSIYKKIRG